MQNKRAKPNIYGNWESRVYANEEKFDLKANILKINALSVKKLVLFIQMSLSQVTFTGHLTFLHFYSGGSLMTYFEDTEAASTAKPVIELNIFHSI